MRFRVLLVALIAAAAGAVAIEPARACSCDVGDTRRALRDAEAAFVGTLLSKGEAKPDENGAYSSSEQVPYRFRIDEAVKGQFASEEDVWSAVSGASCGIEVPIGAQAGLFVWRGDAGRWQSGLCQTHSTEGMREAARPLPPAAERAPPAFVVGGQWGDARVATLTRDGKVAAYGNGPDATHRIVVCPGSARLVEAIGPDISDPPRPLRLVIRELPGLTPVAEWPLPPEAGSIQEIGCADRDANAIVAAVTSTAAHDRSSVITVRGGLIENSWEVPAGPAVVAPRANAVYVASNTAPLKVSRVRAGDGHAEILAELSGAPKAIAVDESGRRLAVTTLQEGADRVHSIDTRGTPPRVHSTDFPAGAANGSPLWLSPAQLLVPLNHADGSVTFDVYDEALKRIGVMAGFGAISELVASGDVVYGLTRTQVRDDVKLVASRPGASGVSELRAFPGTALVHLAVIPPRPPSSPPATTTTAPPSTMSDVAAPSSPSSVAPEAPPTTAVAAPKLRRAADEDGIPPALSIIGIAGALLGCAAAWWSVRRRKVRSAN